MFSVLVTKKKKKYLNRKLPERANQCVIQYDSKLATALRLSFHAATHCRSALSYFVSRLSLWACIY